MVAIPVFAMKLGVSIFIGHHSHDNSSLVSNHNHHCATKADFNDTSSPIVMGVSSFL